MAHQFRADRIDARIISALVDDPRASAMAIAQRTGLSRNTVQARLAKLEGADALESFQRRVDPATLGYPLRAFLFANVTQRKLATIAEELDAIPETLEVQGLSGTVDLLIQVVARDADDLYRIAGQILEIDGIERTTTSLVMRDLVTYRVTSLLNELAHRGSS
ncbi:Lrp/AsnC family transcriptional regulator [Nocardia fusca]|uniref:Lrp/AsnC family transcriptional regulator n=1 Tax=Nocardia fusca TaxID=941183 RepID=UPI0007A739BD|nr:Lrp/AsnC family transcriptional regulator [Nocardia fusca]